jgi:catechol 2,3-dioxygenase-like lactoylglutathione lyase family enzyme
VEIFVPQTEILEPRTGNFRGYNHWGLGVADKDFFVRELEGRGVRVLKLEGTDRFVYFIEDPEGNLIEIYER